MKVEISSGEDLAFVSLELQESCVRCVYVEVRGYFFVCFLFVFFLLWSLPEIYHNENRDFNSCQLTGVESNTWRSSGSHLLLLLCRARIQCVIASDIRLSEFFRRQFDILLSVVRSGSRLLLCTG